MAVVTEFEGLYSIKFTKKVGLPNGFGWIRPGWSVFGDSNVFSAYYQTRPRPKGFIHVKMKPYWPNNPQTAPQQAHRATFAEGVEAWHALDAPTKQYYNDLQYPDGRSGFNRFMSLWLRGVIS